MRTKRSLLLVTALLFVAPTPGETAHASAACGDPVHVAEVYPSADVLPENLLRFYVYFSKPMARRAAVESIHIEDATGAVVSGAFLSTRFALWSPDRRRLTLVLDPGRVKTGLSSHDALGRALSPGRGYNLVIPESLHDVRGCALATPHRKTFTVTQADLSPPAPQSRRIAAPRAGTREPLSIKLDGSYDHVSLAYRLRVRNSFGEVVAGSIRLSSSETKWVFTPRSKWSENSYAVVVDPILEDLAGNRLGRLFDRPADRETHQQSVASHTLLFSPTAALNFKP